MSKTDSITDSSSSSSSTSDSSSVSSKKGGRAWEVLKGTALVLLSIVAITALAVGIMALTNPIGLAAAGTAIGAGITAAIAFGAENAIATVSIGAVGLAILGIIVGTTLCDCQCG